MSTFTQPFKLVLDYDGVIFKNPYAMQLVSNRSAQYVSKKLKIPYANARMINTSRYKVHGHTVKYLQHIGINTTLEEYNDFVFNHIDWNDIEMNIINKDYDPIIDIYLLNKLQNQKCVLFSNAPRLWVDNTLEKLGTKQSVLFDEIFTCDSLEQLKPSKEPYTDIEECYPNTDLLFIDDSILNIHGLGERWKPHWFKPNENIFQCGCKMIEAGGYMDNNNDLERILYPDLELDVL